MLSSNEDIFSSNRIERLCKHDIDVLLLDDADSSNNVAKIMASNGAKEGTVVVVKKQSAGKGRLGRSFISNEENGLYMSIILRPKLPIEKSVNITVIGAVATLEAIEATTGKDCSIKWVNDIFLNDKKVCGSLTEASFDFESESLEYAVLGIGVNVCKPKNGFAPEINDIATAIFDSCAPIGYKSRLCATIIDNLLDYYNDIGNSNYIKKYREKSNLIGKEVAVYRGNDIINGTVSDIDNEANLVVQTENGTVKFNSGEARVRKNEK